MNASKGNMYPWVTHTHAILRGQCPHECSYCYVQKMAERFPAMWKKYHGKIRIVEKELDVDYGSGKTIFIEHMNDLFAEEVPESFIKRIMEHCEKWPDNTYVFQSKNPSRMKGFLTCYSNLKRIAGTTIETNRSYEGMGKAPAPIQRYLDFAGIGKPTFVTIEPIMDFDIGVFDEWLIRLNPTFVNIGADSKGNKLPEPPADKIRLLTRLILDAGIEIREKHNLGRLLGDRP